MPKNIATVTSDEPKSNSTKQHYNESDRKFNIVMYGIKESPPNTNRPNRLQQDLTNINNAFSQTGLTLERQSG